VQKGVQGILIELMQLADVILRSWVFHGLSLRP
jgi:hypothetical protein